MSFERRELAVVLLLHLGGVYHLLRVDVRELVHIGPHGGELLVALHERVERVNCLGPLRSELLLFLNFLLRQLTPVFRRLLRGLHRSGRIRTADAYDVLERFIHAALVDLVFEAWDHKKRWCQRVPKARRSTRVFIHDIGKRTPGEFPLTAHRQTLHMHDLGNGLDAVLYGELQAVKKAQSVLTDRIYISLRLARNAETR